MSILDLVSVVAPVYNCERFVKTAIESVRLQTYPCWELILVNDGSTDDSGNIGQAFARSDSRIKVIELGKNCGVAASRNVGITNAGGAYIAFLDADDIWLPDKLDRQMDFMQSRRCALSCTAYNKIDEDGNPIGRTVEVPDRTDYQKLLSTNVIGNSTAMYDVTQLGKVYLPAVNHEDYALWLKILKMGHEAHGLNECLALYRVRTHSVSSNKLKAASYQWRIYRDTERLPLHTSIGYFFKYAYAGYRKSRVQKATRL